MRRACRTVTDQSGGVLPVRGVALAVNDRAQIDATLSPGGRSPGWSTRAAREIQPGLKLYWWR